MGDDNFSEERMMMVVIYSIVIILNLWIGACDKKNRLVILLSGAFIAIVMGLNTFNSDYMTYEYCYNTQSYSFSVEYGYELLSSILFRLGFSYQQFIFIFFLIAMLIAGIAINNINANFHVCIALYMMTEIFIYTCEIRQTMAYVIYLLALTCLVKNNYKGFLISIIIGGLFHRSLFALIPFVFLYKNMRNNRKILKIYFFCILVMCAIIYVGGNKISWLSLVLSSVLPADKLVYFQTSTNLGFMLFFFANFANIFTVIQIRKIYHKMNEKMTFLDDKQEKFIEIVFNSLLYLSFAMPLCMLNSEFLRYFRFSVFPIIVILSFSFIYKAMLSRKKLNKIYFLKSDLIICLYIICYTIGFQHFRVMEEVMSNNLLF